MGVGILLLAVAATLAVVLATPMGALLRAALVAYVAAAAARACRRVLSPRALRIDRDRRIAVVDHDGRRAGTVRDGSFALPWLTIVRWRPDGGRADTSLLLLPGMASAEQMRNIRVILRWA